MPELPMEQRLSLHEHEWPERDRALWRAARHRAGPLDDDGPAAAWKPKTVRKTVKDYGRWLGYCWHNGQLDPLASPAERITEQRLRAYIDDLRGSLAPATVHTMVNNLCQMVRVMEPRAELGLLHRVVCRLRKLAKPSRNKAARLLDPRIMLEAGIAEMERAASAPADHPALGASHVRDGLLLALLAVRPLRLANFAGLQLGRSIVRRDDGWWLDIDGEETKTGQAQWAPLPRALTMPLDVYVETYRPRLLSGRSDDRLWIGIKGKPMADHGVYIAFTRLTARLFGRPIHPHLMRDAAMTALAIKAPSNVPAGARLLGHDSLATGQRHYNHADQVSAVLLYHEALAEILDEDDHNKGDQP